MIRNDHLRLKEINTRTAPDFLRSLPIKISPTKIYSSIF